MLKGFSVTWNGFSRISKSLNGILKVGVRKALMVFRIALKGFCGIWKGV